VRDVPNRTRALEVLKLTSREEFDSEGDFYLQKNCLLDLRRSRQMRDGNDFYGLSAEE
jgi:hypothetical protein